MSADKQMAEDQFIGGALMRMRIGGIRVGGAQIKSCQVELPRNTFTPTGPKSIIFTRQGRNFGHFSVLIGNRLWENVPASLVRDIKGLEQAIREIGDKPCFSGSGVYLGRDKNDQDVSRNGTVSIDSEHVTGFKNRLEPPAYALLIDWLKGTNKEINARIAQFDNAPLQSRTGDNLIGYSEYFENNLPRLFAELLDGRMPGPKIEVSLV